MPKSRRNALSGIFSSDSLGAVTPLRPEITASPESEPMEAPSPAPVPAEAARPRMRAVPPPVPVLRRRDAFKEATIQQTVYLPPAVHNQLRELAFSERVKMHALIMEGLDAVFKSRGLKPLSILAPKD